MSFVQLIRKGRRDAQRQTEQVEQRKEQRGPKIPKRTKQLREADEKDRRTGKCGKEHIKPQLPAADAAGVGEQTRGKQQRKEDIERIGETARRPAAQAQCAQQIIDKRKAHAKQECAGKCACLRSDLHAHRLSLRAGARRSRRRAARPHRRETRCCRPHAARRRQDSACRCAGSRP